MEYRNLHKRLNRLFIKSIAFLIISKFIIGIAIEVPYDLITTGIIAVMPLIINLFFPPLYLASLRISLHVPSKSNARTIRNYMEKLLYQEASTVIRIPKQRRSSIVVKFLILIAFLLPLVITVYILERLGFNDVQMIIFFVFFSTASFLGFRLSVLIRELELITRQTGLLASMRDFFYLPFILVGQWLSRKYSKINAIARLLDVGVELPLKTVLRLLRQWIRFLNEKHEELY